jgi:hypothetical protein
VGTDRDMSRIDERSRETERTREILCENHQVVRVIEFAGSGLGGWSRGLVSGGLTTFYLSPTQNILPFTQLVLKRVVCVLGG